MKKIFLLSLMFGSALFANQNNNFTVVFDKKFASQKNQEEQALSDGHYFNYCVTNAWVANDIDSIAHNLGPNASDRLFNARYGNGINVFHLLAFSKRDYEGAYKLFERLGLNIGFEDSKKLLSKRIGCKIGKVKGILSPADIAYANGNRHLGIVISDWLYGHKKIEAEDMCYVFREIHNLVRNLNNSNIKSYERFKYNVSLASYKELAIYMILECRIDYKYIDSDGYTIPELIVATGCEDVVKAFVRSLPDPYKGLINGRISLNDILNIVGRDCNYNEIQVIRNMLDRKGILGEAHDNLPDEMAHIFSTLDRISDNTQAFIAKYHEWKKLEGSKKDQDQIASLQEEMLNLFKAGIRDQVTIDKLVFPTAYLIADVFACTKHADFFKEYILEHGFKGSDCVVKCSSDSLFKAAYNVAEMFAKRLSDVADIQNSLENAEHDENDEEDDDEDIDEQVVNQRIDYEYVQSQFNKLIAVCNMCENRTIKELLTEPCFSDNGFDASRINSHFDFKNSDMHWNWPLIKGSNFRIDSNGDNSRLSLSPITNDQNQN